MVLYLYSSFLVLMTTQSALQYSFTFTHSHTHSYSASITSTLLFYGGLFGVQHLAQGHFGMQMWKTGDRTADLQVGGRPLYPSATAGPQIQLDCTTVQVFHNCLWTQSGDVPRLTSHLPYLCILRGKKGSVFFTTWQWPALLTPGANRLTVWVEEGAGWREQCGSQ